MNQIIHRASKPLATSGLLDCPHSELDAGFTRRDHYPGLHKRNLSRLPSV